MKKNQRNNIQAECQSLGNKINLTFIIEPIIEPKYIEVSNLAYFYFNFKGKPRGKGKNIFYD